jgi:hypothetical protein
VVSSVHSCESNLFTKQKSPPCRLGLPVNCGIVIVIRRYFWQVLDSILTAVT